MPFTVEYFIIRHTHPNVLLPIRNNNLLFFFTRNMYGVKKTKVWIFDTCIQYLKLEKCFENQYWRVKIQIDVPTCNNIHTELFLCIVTKRNCKNGPSNVLFQISRKRYIFSYTYYTKCVVFDAIVKEFVYPIRDRKDSKVLKF